MMHRLNLNRDLIAGLMFAAWGIAGLWLASEYPRGTALRMGPGYMPVMLCWGLVLLGGAIATKGALRAGAKLAGWHLRPLVLVLAAILAFAVLIEPAGLALATLAIVLIGAAAGLEFRFGEALALALGLAAGAVGLFVYGLKLPMPVWPAALF
jgi:Tripartite tricarboxylate transporter TctB family